MHTKRPPLLAASLLAIMTISPLFSLRVEAGNADSDGIRQITTNPYLKQRDDQQDHNNQPTQDFFESKQSVPIQEYPRQLFRLHILDSRSRITQKNRYKHQLSNNNSTVHANKQQQHHGSNKPNKNISNATLKKLLSQAIQQQQNRLAILARNSTASSTTPTGTTTTTSKPTDLSSEIDKSEQANSIITGNSRSSTTSTTELRSDDTNVIYKPEFVTRSPIKPGGGNFKFVFIQRAAANATPTASASSSKNKQPDSNGVLPTPVTATTSSLAASISRQLASSLLYSAANFVSNLNLTSSQPSLSDLKNQLTTTRKFADELEDSKETIGNDIQRLTTKADERLDLQVAISTTKAPKTITSPSSSSSQKPKYRKNSKIYNLPVKFVANGQPNGQIVIQTIKQHLAAMKQAGSAKGLLSTTMPDQGIVKHANNQNNFNRDQSTTNNIRDNNQKMKLKGFNSRLIYLPLRMLINGKPSRISVITSRLSRNEVKSTTKSTTSTSSSIDS